MIDFDRPGIKEIMNLKQFFHFYFFNMDIPVNIFIFDLKFPVCVPKVHLQGRVSQNFDLGPSFILWKKTGNFLSFFLNTNFYIL